MKKSAIFLVAMLLISAVPLAGGDNLFDFVNGNGTDASQFGLNVTYLGDINGDGYDDVAVGAPYNDSADGSRADCGAVYIFFGYPGMDIYHGKNIDVSSANVTIYGANAGDHFGWSVADAGDVNGDGYNDTIVGAPDALTGTTERNGSAYVFYGKTTWSSTWDLSTTGADVTITGENDADKFGASVSGAGNYDNSGNDDIIVGAPYADAGGTDRGKAYIFYGDGSIPTKAQNADMTFSGKKDNGHFGFSVKGAGNVDGEAGDDVIIGEPGNSMAYVYYSPTENYATGEQTEIGTQTGTYLDTFSSDDSYEVLTEGGATDTLLLDEGFESGLPAGWSHGAWDYTNSPPDTKDNWQVGAPSGSNSPTAHSGSNVAGVVIDGDYPTDEGSYLETPSLSIPAGALSPKFYFWLYTSTESGYDGLNIKVSVDGGQYENITTSLPYDGALSTSYSNPIGGEDAWSGSHSWTNVSVDMTPYIGHTVQFRWHWGSDSSNTDWGPAIDDVWMHYNGSSTLVHKWNFTIPEGEKLEFIVEANHTANTEGDDFTFSYSTDDLTYTPMLTVTKTSDDNSYQAYSLPNLGGRVYIKVEDTDRTEGNDVKDSLYIDHMCIRQIKIAPLVGDADTDFGSSVSGIGDVDGDGKDDVVVGAPETTNGNAYIYSGSDMERTTYLKNETDTEFNAGSPTKTDVNVMASNPVENGHINQTGTVARYENFNDMSDWDSVDSGISPSTDTSIYSGYSARIVDNDTGGSQQAIDSITYPNSGTVDFYFRVNQTVGDPDGTADGLFIAAIAKVSGLTTTYYLTMGVITNNSYIQYRDGGSWVNLTRYKEYTWYWMRWDYNMSTNTYDIYLNDTHGRLVKYADDAQFAVTGYTINQFWMDTYNAPAGNSATLTAYVDELNIATPSTKTASYTSAIKSSSDYIAAVRPSWNYTIADDSNIWLNISRDGGTTWNSTPLQNGVWYTFPNEPPGTDFCYKIEFKTVGEYSSIAYDVKFIVVYSHYSVVITGEASGDRFGYSVSGGSDIGGDGTPDIIVGAPYNDGKAADGGAVYVFNGSATMPSSISASNADYINYSANAGAHFGFSVSKAEDVNGDGFNDVIAGSPAYSLNSGRADILSCHKPPRIVSYDLQDSSGASKLNTQIDVNSEYHFIVNITHPNGWSRVRNVTIKAWYDFGSESNPYNGTKGGDVNLFMVYNRVSGTFTLKWPTGGEVTLGTCTDTAIDSNTHSLEFYFTPGPQFRYAPGNGWASGPGLNDINSWNFEINVTDIGGWYDSIEDEFGVYRYTSVSASGNPQAIGYPGLTYAMSPNTTLTYSSNADFRLNVTIDDLLNATGALKIGASNVSINWTGHGLNNYVSFTGPNSPIWIFGGPSSFSSAPLSGTSQTITIYWKIAIPGGTVPDTYTSPVNYIISQT